MTGDAVVAAGQIVFTSWIRLRADGIISPYRSHRAHALHTTLSEARETIVLTLRQSLYLPLDALLFITKRYVNAEVSRFDIARLFKREGMARLKDVIPEAEGETIAPKKTFKDYEPGFMLIDIKYLPQIPDETSRRSLFVAINGATRWVIMHIYSDMTETSSVDRRFRLKLASPIKTSEIPTDIYRPFRHPQTNGMAERFSGRINELIQQTRFDSKADLQTTLLNYLKLYNRHNPQRAIGNKTSILALKE